jgi:predicted enzyme related to lactoylglutathione lyase
VKIRRVVPNISAGELAQSQKFYADFLGFDVAMDMGWIITFASPDNPTSQISVIQDDQAPRPPDRHADISVEVDDADAAYARAAELALEIIYPLTDEPWGVRRFFVVDPNGIVVNILSQQDGTSSSD